MTSQATTEKGTDSLVLTDAEMEVLPDILKNVEPWHNFGRAEARRWFATITYWRTRALEAERGWKCTFPSMDDVQDVLRDYDVGTPEYRCAEFVWVNRPSPPSTAALPDKLTEGT